MGALRRWGGWGFADRGPRLSVLELVKSGTLDLRLAALLWLLMANRASVIVAAGPSLAGKTTTLNVMLDFLRPEVREVRLRGDDEDFGFLKDSKPEQTYMVAEEFSDHLSEYVWGDVARRVFQLLQQGYAVGGTMHARTAQESLAILHHHLGLPLALLARLEVVVTLSVGYSRGYDAEPVRRIETVSLITSEDGGSLSLEVLASRSSPENPALDIADDAALRKALGMRFRVEQSSVTSDIEARERFLKRLFNEGRHSRDEVRKGVIEFYRSSTGA
ncbi:MAG: hypothetical protein HYX84_04020 [Chloroflexi bacterium]|nr:hypothetical protein [Chloroflexota bacterium]